MSSTNATQAEFAALMGWTPGRVSQLKKAGRLVLTADGRVDVERSQALIQSTATPSKQGVAERHARERAGLRGPGLVRRDPPAHDPADDADGSLVVTESADQIALRRARAAADREEELAALARMERLREEGRSLDRAAAERAMTDAATATRTALERLADKLALPLAAESDPNAVHALITAAVDEICDDLAQVADDLVDGVTQPRQ